MKCYYEELGIKRDANDTDVKSAYRKLALRWHPDKNPDCMEEAQQQFVLIQQAYEVLIDPQERAFYDNHREQILRGKNSSYEDNCINVFEYFTVTCFKGFGDDAKSFYAVYKEVFGKIIAEDAEFMDDEEEIENIPTFGDSNSSYEEVVGPFYVYWSVYSTKKSYAWLCPYNIQEAKDRRVVRAIDKEMKKVVQKARKERNEEIRSLVAFVRKRDKRVIEYNRKFDENMALNRQKQEQKRLEIVRKRQLEFKELQNNVKTVVDEVYEARLKELEQEYNVTSSENEDEDVELKVCAVGSNCGFSTQVENDQDDHLAQEEEDISDNFDDLYCVACNKNCKHKRALISHKSSKKHLDNVEKLHAEEKIAANGENAEAQESSVLNNKLSDIEDSITLKKQKKKCKSKQSFTLDANLENTNVSFPEVLNGVENSSDENEWTDKKTMKKKQKKKSSETTANKTGNNTNATTKNVINPSEEKEHIESPNLIHACATCNKQYDSKNKLFSHLKSTNHSIYIPGKENATLDGDRFNKKRSGKRN